MIVNSQQVVTRAKMRLRLMETSEADLEILKYIEEASRGLNASSTYIINCHEAEIDCHKAPLPCSYESLEYFCINGCSGNCTESSITTIPPTPVICSCPSVFYYDKSALMQGCGDSCGWYGNYFYIQNGYIYFPSSVTADTVKIWYKGFNVDKDGLMIVDEEMERGLSAYAAFQFAMARPEAYQPIQINGWNREWISQKKYINGKKIIREFKLQKPEISLLVNAVLANNRLAGQGRYGGR